MNKILENSASILLACAISRLFPKGELLGGGPLEGGFYCDVSLDFPLNEECLPLLEEHLRQLVTEKLPMRIHTMIRDNGEAFLRDKAGKTLREGDEPVVEIAQMGDFYEEGRGPVVANTGELAHLKILSAEGNRFWGIVAKDKQELKEKLKAFKTLQGCDHRKQTKLLSQRDGVWVLGTRLTKARLALELQVISLLEEMENQIFTCLGECEIEEGTEILEGEGEGTSLKNSHIYRYDLTRIPVDEKDLENRLISSLQFIEKWNKILSFGGFWSFRGSKPELKRAERALKSSFSGELRELESAGWPRLEYYWVDKGGIPYLGSSIGIKKAPGHRGKRGGRWQIELTLASSFERLIAISLENGTLPPWMEAGKSPSEK